jgi:hypothetical protein
MSDQDYNQTTREEKMKHDHKMKKPSQLRMTRRPPTIKFPKEKKYLNL